MPSSDDMQVLKLSDYKPVLTEDFWYEQNITRGPRAGDVDIKINRNLFLMFLQSNGFYKYFYVPDDYFYVRINNHIVERTTAAHIKDFVLNYVRNLELLISEELTDVLLKGANNYFGEMFLSFLEPVELEFHSDKKDKAYFYFKNGFVEVSKNDIEIHPYSKLDKYIWHNQIVDRDFKQNKNESVFWRFLCNITNEKETPDRYFALASAMGYLLHAYKKKAEAKAVILVDEKLSQDATDANGGTGKGLIANALKQIRRTVFEDGQTFQPLGQFAYQNVEMDTRIFVLDDVRLNFPFVYIFSIITEDWRIEKKHVSSYIVPFQDSPKILITTNFTIPETSTSYNRRIFEVELHNYYNEHHTPFNEFGHMFFEDWDESEWNKFDTLMMASVQFYFLNGLWDYEKINLKQRKLIQLTNSDFVFFAEDYLHTGVIDRDPLYAKFVELNPSYEKSKWFTMNRFTKWVRSWAEFNGFQFEVFNTKNVRKYRIWGEKVGEKVEFGGEKVEQNGQLDFGHYQNDNDTIDDEELF